MNNSNYTGIIAITAIIIFILLSYFFINKKNNDELKNDFGITEGKVTNFTFSNYSYYLDYEFYVSGKKFKGSIGGLAKFYCDDNKLNIGCIGKNFKVKYSKKNPNISDINLREFNKYKSYKP